MSDTPVDVVIPCFNGARTLGQTIDRALAQTHRAVRVLVVDDGSTDGSRRVVESYGGRVGYVHKENGGQASARNLGISRTEAPFVCLLDADDLPEPRMVESLLAPLESDPTADLAHGDVLGFWGDDFLHPHAEFWRPAAPWPSYLEPLSILCALHGSATLVRRRLFERAGLFPESRALQGCEDWHFFLQAALGGAVFRRVPEVLCLYRYHASASSSSARAVARRETNLMRSAASLFRGQPNVTTSQRAILSIGVLSVAARWLSLGDAAAFEEGRSVALSTAPASLERIRDVVASGIGLREADLVNMRLADLLVEVGQPMLAAVLFLRCRDWPALRPEVARRGEIGMLDRVRGAVAAVVDEEIARRRAVPSFATHLATGLAALDLSDGDRRAAQARYEQACALDPGNVLPALELLEMELRFGRAGAALARWRRLGQSPFPNVPAERLRRVLRALAVRFVQRHPRLREAARRLAAHAASFRLRR
jgi:GT2 family glycosyltransferase